MLPLSRRPRLIVCDWNGTLVDDLARAAQATNRVLGSLGIAPLDLARFRAAFVLPLQDFFTNLQVESASVSAAVDAFNRQLAQGDVRPSAGAVEFLKRARCIGVPVGVVSAADTSVILSDAVRLGISHEFDFMVGAAKSKSAILERLQPETSDACIYVGDTEFDMLEAQKAGFLPIGFGGGYRPGASLLAAGAATVVDDLSELIGLLRLDGLA